MNLFIYYFNFDLISSISRVVEPENSLFYPSRRNIIVFPDFRTNMQNRFINYNIRLINSEYYTFARFTIRQRLYSPGDSPKLSRFHRATSSHCNSISISVWNIIHEQNGVRVGDYKTKEKEAYTINEWSPSRILKVVGTPIASSGTKSEGDSK